ncbi:hypothetical protein GQ43DRAFT_314798 [Delitschia confertaspora ATCC 74209]|uniref:Uncharacterized protein n=1 Tax=Delitschia confertaspora ATCC 74209 TaxID=1513339 RepID=A0A9P4JNF8_9PLEO|nr:hypothetical protein GQ43DRAFT_314798 [Delitschia confertaspora ATCC 74209]
MRRKGLEKKEEGVGSKSWADILRALVTKRLKGVADHSRVHHSLRSGSTYPAQSTQPIQACEPSQAPDQGKVGYLNITTSIWPLTS